jgi:hypothetical protein
MGFPSIRLNAVCTTLNVMNPRLAMQPITRNHQIEVAMLSESPSPVNNAT